MYNNEFYQSQIGGSGRSAEVVSKILMKIYPQINNVLDIGCGTGIWLKKFQNLNVENILGIDFGSPGSNMQIDVNCHLAVNLSETINLKKRFDLVISLEVIEHIDSAHEDIFIDNIISHGDLILFSGAIPGQVGTAHCNERWQSYWISKFNKKGYDCWDIIRPIIWYDTRVEWWYRQNIFLFVKKGRSDLTMIIKNYPSCSIANLVHPECFATFRGCLEYKF